MFKSNNNSNNNNNNTRINDEAKNEKCFRNKFQRELNSLEEYLSIELSPLREYRNKPIVDLKKPELYFSYESFFNSPMKIRNDNSRFASPMLITVNNNNNNVNGNNYRDSSFSYIKTRILSPNKNPNLRYNLNLNNNNNHNPNNNPNNNYISNFNSKRKVVKESKISKYSNNFVLMANSINPDDSLEEFVKGKLNK